MAEGDGLLNRYTDLNLYRGFESLPLRQFFYIFGEVAEWFNATVLKTVVPHKGTVGSNPSLSAIFQY